MGNLSIALLLTCTMIIACSTQTSKKVVENIKHTPANSNLETKINISSSAAKAGGAYDSAVIIKPMHKSRHQKKYKIK